MRYKIVAALGVVATLTAMSCLAVPSLAQDQGGISSSLISRCAGKFGTTLRAGDEAFPLFSIDGLPWVKIEHAQRTVGDAVIADTVTGTGARLRRRGEVVSFRYTCLIDGNGEAVAFNSTDLLPEERQTAPPGTILRGNAFYRPRIRLPRGAELRVQLLDATRGPTGEVLTEAVVRSSWVEPMPFGLRLPPDIKFDGRKLVVDARLAVGSATLYRLKQRQTIAAGELQKSITLMLDAVVGSSP